MRNRQTPRADRDEAKGKGKGKDSMTTHHLALDRFERDREGVELAVLVTDEGRSIVVPKGLLPPGSEPGMALTLSLALDPVATAAVARQTEAIRADLKKTDPGGTIRL